MDFDVETLTTPAIYHHGMLLRTELAEWSSETRHWFGGPLDLKIEGPPHGPHPLHRIVTLDLADPRLGASSIANLRYLPLVYGMRFDGFDIDYAVASDCSIHIKRSSMQTSSDDWPYEGFPDTLPRLGLRLLEPLPVPLDEAQDLTHQGFVLSDPEEMVVIVPNVTDYGGVSLWDKWGRGVQIMFYFTPSDRRVYANNQTD